MFPLIGSICSNNNNYNYYYCYYNCPLYYINRTYQEEAIHKKLACTPWTSKPPDSHYIIVTNGSSNSDVEWKCQDGYVVYSADMCIQVTTIPPTTSTTNPTNVTSVVSVMTTSTLSSNSFSGNILTITLLLVFGIISIVVIIIIITVVIIKKKRGRRSCKDYSPEIEAGEDKSSLLKPSDKLPEEINFRFFFLIVVKLGVHESQRFLKLLENPSGKFNVDTALGYQREKSRDSMYYLTNTCLEWATENMKVDHRKCVHKALEYLGQPNLLKEIEDSESQAVLTQADDSLNSDVRLSDADDLRTAEKKESQTDKFRLYIYLTEKLGYSDSVKFISHLSNKDTRFSARKFLEEKDSEHQNFQLSFAETLKEWHLRNPDLSLKHHITSILEDMNKNSIIQDETFKNLLQNIDSLVNWQSQLD